MVVRLVTDSKGDNVAPERSETGSSGELGDWAGVDLERGRVAGHDVAHRLERRVLADVSRRLRGVHKVRRDYDENEVKRQRAGR